jgi:uncharacterized protein YuzE
MKGKFKVKYRPEADALVITVRSGTPDRGDEAAPGVIMHYSKKNELVEIEILDASELISATVRERAKATKEALVGAKLHLSHATGKARQKTDKENIAIKPPISAAEFIKEMEGCIKEGAPRLDPLELKKIWELTQK